MMPKNAVELAEILNIDFVHLQKVWKVFATQRDYGITSLYTELKELLTEDEKIYLIYIGLDHISTVISESLEILSKKNKVEAPNA